MRGLQFIEPLTGGERFRLCEDLVRTAASIIVFSNGHKVEFNKCVSFSLLNVHVFAFGCMSLFDFLSISFSVCYYGVWTGSLFYLFIWTFILLPSWISRVALRTTFSETSIVMGDS